MSQSHKRKWLLEKYQQQQQSTTDIEEEVETNQERQQSTIDSEEEDEEEEEEQNNSTCPYNCRISTNYNLPCCHTMSETISLDDIPSFWHLDDFGKFILLEFFLLVHIY
jgi:hypothetical protein